MATDQQTQDPQQDPQAPAPAADAQQPATPAQEADGLKDKKPEELTPDELRLMADTMPGEGPGD